MGSGVKAWTMHDNEWRAQLGRSLGERRQRLLWAKDEVDADGWLDIHGLAAVALYGQPYGFTHADVVMLRHLAKPADASCDLRNLADRIEALLPPKELEE